MGWGASDGDDDATGKWESLGFILELRFFKVSLPPPQTNQQRAEPIREETIL
jgi:hypothetical protein